MSRSLNMISLSDIHLGHDRVPAEFIINNLNTLIPDNESMATVDIIWLAGDVFDQLLQFPADEIGPIQRWMVRLMRICEKWDIVLRILEGTPSHDRRQSKHFIHLKESMDIKIDVQYIDVLAIEYIERFNIHVLYVPDEYHATTQQTWEAVQELLLMHNLKQVDYAIMHGMFEHQIPNGIKLPHHVAENYLSIVKKYIFIGHIHQMSVFQRILAQGSTDRLSHDDEMDKGMWRVKSYDDVDCARDEITFVVNTGAMRFDTLDWTQLETFEEMVKLTDLACQTLPPGSFIRIIANKEEDVLALRDSYKREYSQFNWSTKVVKDANNHDISVRLTTYQPVPINVNTIDTLVLEKLTHMGIDDIQKDRIMAQLQKVK